MDAPPEAPRESKVHNFQSPAAFYGSLLPTLREAAKKCGYALAVHGSLRRDLDLMAMPWTEDADHMLILVQAIMQAAGGYTELDFESEFCVRKPHGRVSWIINLSDSEYIDLSVMPPVRVEAHPPSDPAAVS